MPALASGNIQVIYGGGTAMSRAIGTGRFRLSWCWPPRRATYRMRLMVNASIRNPADLKGKKLGVGLAGLDEYATLLYFEKIGLVSGKMSRWSTWPAGFRTGWRP